MEAPIYNRAVKRIATLRGELTALQQFIETYHALAVGDPREVDGDPAVQRLTRDHESADPNDEPVRIRATPQAELEKVVERVIIAHGAPLQRGELMHRVKQMGLVVGGQNEATNFGSKLSRATRLVNISGYGYWPKDRPFEPGSYCPIVEVQRVAAE